MPVPVISVGQMRDWENASWAAGISSEEVIQNVGRIVARRLLQITRPGDSILVLAGRGHNGDDARAAAPHLPERNVTVIDVVNPAEAYELVSRNLEKTTNGRWIVDGLFGIGLNRALSPDWVRLINLINNSDLPVFAVDSPSGLNVETGETEGAAIRATITLTVGAPKLGLLFPKAVQYVGRLEVVPKIGLVDCPFTADLNWTIPEDFAKFPPRRAAETHKGTYGHIAIFAGSLGYHGASVLATQAAQRAQPGLVSLWTHPSVYGPVASHLRATMVHPWKPGNPLPGSITAILIGPGLAAADLGEDFKTEVRSFWLESPLPVVVDASALDWLPTGPTPRHAIRVVTPHPGEAARMLAVGTDQIQADRVRSVRTLSRRYGDCWVVLKGHQTLVGRSSGEIYVNSSGNPFLAQGGSGDVLGGYICGLLAQTRFRAGSVRAIRYAVWEHGTAADRLCSLRKNWTPEDLVVELGNEPGKI